MPTLVLLCGKPFSGKSTLAQRFAERGAAVVSFDAINLERGLHGGDGLPVTEWAATLEIAKQRTAALLAEHPLVVVDDTLCFRWIRDTFRALALTAETQPVLVHLDFPESVLWDRMTANDRTKERGGIAEAVLAEHLATFESPEEDEAPVVLRGPEEVEAWLAAF